MNKKQKSWLRVSSVFLLATGLVHSISLFLAPLPKNETETQLRDLMLNYRLEMGAGFEPTTANLFTALSSCFSLLCFLGGVLLLYFVRKNLQLDILKGVLNIFLIVFGITFLMMAYFTFLPPIILTGVVFVCLISTRAAIRGTGAPTTN